MSARRVLELGRERARADPGGVSLDDAEHEAGRRRTEPGAGGRRPRHRVGGGDERIGAVIDVEQHALRALEQDPFAGEPGFVERLPDRAGEAKHEFGDLAEIALESGPVDRRLAEAGTQRIVMCAQAVELWPELAEMGEIADPDRAAADLVLISRTDAATGGADLALAARILAQRVEIAVERQDQRAGVGDSQGLGRYRHPLLGQLCDLGAKRPGIEHDAIADHRQGAADDAGGEQ